MRRFAAFAAAALLAASPAFAQTGPATPAPATTGGATLAPAAGNPNLAVASVKMDGGTRASKIIGAAVYADPNTQIASVDDIMLDSAHKAVFAILGVGGVLGVGAKLVAVPFDQLKPGPDGKLTMPGATKDSLNAMPNFTYGG